MRSRPAFRCAMIVASSLGILVPMAAGAGNADPNANLHADANANTNAHADAIADAKADLRLLARGEYLVNSSGCHLCHTPKRMGKDGPEADMSRMLAGHPEALQMPPAPELPEGPWTGVSAATSTAWSGPWGISYSANLTPDLDTGLGRWTLRDFVDTLRSGRRMGRGRKVLPPMPVSAYKNFNDHDMAAIFTYLQSIPAVRNRVPEPITPGS